MALEVFCPNCGARYKLPEEQLGKKVRCKKCEQTFRAGDDGIQDAPRETPKPRRRLAEPQLPRRDVQDGRFPAWLLVTAGAAAAALVLCCGGGMVVFLMWQAREQAAVQRIQAAEANQARPPAEGPRQPAGPEAPAERQQLPPDFGQPPDFPRFPGRPAAGPPITTLKEALDAVRDNDPQRRWTGADWLCRAPRDDAKLVEVSKALDPLVRNAQPDVFGKDAPRQAALKALREWGTSENVKTLVEFLQREHGTHGAQVHMQDQLQDAMTALARIGDERGAEGIVVWLGNFFLGGSAEGALRQMGAKAEKVLLKHYDDPDADDLPAGMRLPRAARHAGGPFGARRDAVRRLLRDGGTKPAAILAQVVVDLKGGDAGRRQIAAESLENVPVIEAQREEVSKALNTVLNDPDDDISASAVPAARTWGTSHNVPALVRRLSDEGPFASEARKSAMEALAAIKDEAGVWPVARLFDDHFSEADARKAIQKFGPVAEKVALVHLKDTDDASRSRAWDVLGLTASKASVDAMEAAAKKEKPGEFRTRADGAIRQAKLRP
jgi:predicted Zn finger-like uncharacterized protein